MKCTRLNENKIGLFNMKGVNDKIESTLEMIYYHKKFKHV